MLEVIQHKMRREQTFGGSVEGILRERWGGQENRREEAGSYTLYMKDFEDNY